MVGIHDTTGHHSLRALPPFGIHSINAKAILLFLQLSKLWTYSVHYTVYSTVHTYILQYSTYTTTVLVLIGKARYD